MSVCALLDHGRPGTRRGSHERVGMMGDEHAEALENPTQPGDSIVPAPAPLPLRPGQVLLDKYEVERILGVGGMGIVVSAMHLELGERVAIKAMLPEVAASRDHATRFAREAQAAARIKSEFVARVTDVARLPDGTPFMVMEYLEGETLATYLAREGAMEIEDAVDTLLEACVALAEAHRLGIVHRDVKPANLFLARRSDGGDILKVLDFGISKSEENVTITRTTGAIGTPSYMSPEQLRAAGTVRGTADIWSLGVVLFEMLTLELPYEGSTFADICAQVLVSPPRSPGALRADIPAELEEVILRCLQRDQADRFPTVLALAQALEPFATDEGVGLVARIEQIGSSRPSLVSADEVPISGRRSFTSLSRATPRSLTPRATRAVERADGAERSTPPPASEPAASEPPTSAAPTTADPSRTPPASWRTVAPDGGPGPAAPRSSRRWIAAATGGLAIGVAAWLMSREPATGVDGAASMSRAPAGQAPGTAPGIGTADAIAPATTASAATPVSGATVVSASASASASAPAAPAASPPLPSSGPSTTSARAPSPGATTSARRSTSAVPPPPSAGKPAASSRFEDFGGRR